MIAVNRGDEKQRANAFVEICFRTAKRVKFHARCEELGCGFAGAPVINREIAGSDIGGVDNVGDAESCRQRGRRNRRELSHGYHGWTRMTEKGSQIRI